MKALLTTFVLAWTTILAAPPTADPADAKPSGTAHAVVSKFGDRVEYYWSDFKRVDDAK